MLLAVRDSDGDVGKSGTPAPGSSFAPGSEPAGPAYLDGVIGAALHHVLGSDRTAALSSPRHRPRFARTRVSATFTRHF
jgi:hypothetical protein